jgi:hypothetical protein
LFRITGVGINPRLETGIREYPFPGFRAVFISDIVKTINIVPGMMWNIFLESGHFPEIPLLVMSAKSFLSLFLRVFNHQDIHLPINKELVLLDIFMYKRKRVLVSWPKHIKECFPSCHTSVSIRRLYRDRVERGYLSFYKTSVTENEIQLFLCRKEQDNQRASGRSHGKFPRTP